jgi:hypothetical protein
MDTKKTHGNRSKISVILRSFPQSPIQEKETPRQEKDPEPENSEIKTEDSEMKTRTFGNEIRIPGTFF